MKYRNVCRLVAFLLLFSLSACSSISPTKQTETPRKNSAQPVNSTQPVATTDKPVPIKDGYWYLACKNTNAVLYKNMTGSRGLEFELVSAFPFESDELAVELETSVPNVSYKVSCDKDVKENEEIFPFYLYLCYQGIDWRQTDMLAEMQNMYEKGYRAALDQGKLPKLFRYIFGISFDLDKLNSMVSVNAITLTLRGEKKRYTLENLLLDGEKEFGYTNTSISTTLAITDAPISISNDGVLDLTYLDLQSQEPFTLTGLSLFGEDPAAIAGCSVTLTQVDGTATDMKWDCKTPIQVLTGESVRINSFCKDTRLAGVMEAVTSKYIMVQYLSADGKECTELIQGLYRMRQGLYDLYAAANGANVLSYYLDYYSVNPGMIQSK